MNDFNARVHRAIDKAIVRDRETARQLPEAPLTDAMVEAAAQALFIDERGEFLRPGNPWLTTFEGSVRPKYALRARLALEAALAVAPAPVEQARDEYADQMNLELRQSIAAQVLTAMDVDQYLIDAVRNATPPKDAS